MVKLLAVGNIWHGLHEASRENSAQTIRVVKCVRVYEVLVVGGMGDRSLGLCRWLTVVFTSFVDCVTTLPAFTVVLGVEKK
jgi:hypothetical protein